ELKLLLDLHDYVILIQLCEDGRHLTLAKRVVQGVVDHLGGYAESRSGISIDNQIGLKAVVLLIARDVPELRERRELVYQPGRPLAELLSIGIFERVLELCSAYAILDSQVLDRLHEECNAFSLTQLRLEPADHF